MPTTIQDKIEEISLMLVMTADGDAAGCGLLVDLLQELEQLCSSTPGMERLAVEARFVASAKEDPSILDKIHAFTSAAQRFQEHPEGVRFSFEAASSPAASSDISPEIDQRFLAEFIETHRLLLQDFESSLIDFQSNSTDPAEIETLVKRYIHNLKGDSGSIGLTGIARVCHEVETVLTVSSAAAMIAPLLEFKEWIVESLTAFTEGHPPARNADAFLKSLCSDHQPAVAAPVAAEVKSAAAPVHQPTGSLAGTKYNVVGEKELLAEFSTEVEEHLINVESVLLDSQDTVDRDGVDTIFRAVHSVKGASAYFTLDEMTKSSHILENFLVEVREGKREFDTTLKNLLLVYVDLLRNVLARAKKAVQADNVMIFSDAAAGFLDSLEAYRRNERVVAKPAPVVASIAVPTGSPPSPTPTPSSRAEHETTEVAAEHKTEKVAVKNFVKVDTARLDHLIDSIGEMVIYSSMLIRDCRELLKDHEKVMDTTRRVEKFSRDLQDIGMSMRLVPIKGLFQKMSRLVWDTSKKLGKEVDFTMEGEDTELDRNLIDKLADPLMHMVRNSLDHGIEPADERSRQGKPVAGRVKLSAYHSGGSIHIRIEDDGKGLDSERLLAKAIEKGIITEGQKLSESEVFQLIFAPGFSTAAVVTDISGRGVGMDVVRRNVESLRGRINIQSRVGKGSTFTIELPLTLAIIDGVQIQVGTEDFIIPSLSIIEFVRAKPQMLSETLDKGETLHFRGSYLPIYRLSELYAIAPRLADPLEATMVIVENDHELVAIMVDDILGECSTVIKSLGPVFEEGKGIAGCSIMPRGNVALILDVRSLVTLARSSYRRFSTVATPKTPAFVEQTH